VPFARNRVAPNAQTLRQSCLIPPCYEFEQITQYMRIVVIQEAPRTKGHNLRLIPLVKWHLLFQWTSCIFDGSA